MSTHVLGGEARPNLMGTKKPRNTLLSSPSSAKLLLLQLICPGSETGRDWDIPCVTAQLLERVAGGKKAITFYVLSSPLLSFHYPINLNRE